MKTNIPDRQAICEVLMEEAVRNQNLMVMCSDSKGSAALAPFEKAFPDQFTEVGIAEQNLVSMAAGVAKCGYKVFVAAPASFLTTRSYEQAKVDVAYSDTDVKLVGISGGISYGALGMTHHSLQDIAAMSALPNMRVYLPSDQWMTRKLTKALLLDDAPAYVRVGRAAVPEIYDAHMEFQLNKAVFHGIAGEQRDVLIVACGEMTASALLAAKQLNGENIKTAVIDMYCVKPLDEALLLAEAAHSDLVVTVEEHSIYGGLGAMVSQAVAGHCPRKVVNMALPDEPVIAGESKAVFEYYHLDASGICKTIMEMKGRL